MLSDASENIPCRKKYLEENSEDVEKSLNGNAWPIPSLNLPLAGSAATRIDTEHHGRGDGAHRG